MTTTVATAMTTSAPMIQRVRIAVILIEYPASSGDNRPYGGISVSRREPGPQKDGFRRLQELIRPVGGPPSFRGVFVKPTC